MAGESQKSTDELAEALVRSLQKKLWVAVVLALVAASSSVLNYVNPDVRAKSFTSDDWEVAEQNRIDRAEALEYKLEIMRLGMLKEARDYVDQYYRPPIAARIRIEALEKAERARNPAYSPPTEGWQ